MDKMREEFESHFRAKSAWTDRHFVMHAGNYLNATTFYEYETWKASRATLSVKLPIERDGYGQNFTCYEQDELLSALDDAGVRYK